MVATVQDRDFSLPGAVYLIATYVNKYAITPVGPRNSNIGVRGSTAFVIDDEIRELVYISPRQFYSWLTFG